MRSMYLATMTFAALLSFSNNLLAKEAVITPRGETISYSLGQQYIVQSKILGEERNILVYLPEKYQTSTHNLPVVYLMEGDKHYQHATIAVERVQKSGWMPASVIVAVADGEGTNIRDYEQETDNFLNFINQEVQPFITKNFRVSDYKTIFGHRISGKFVLETFIKDPTEFDNYIVANPYIRQGTIDDFDEFLTNNRNLNQSLYFSMGTLQDNGSYNVDPVEKLAKLFEKKAPKSMQWKYQYLPLHGVFASANVTLYDALSTTFLDYQGPFIDSYEDFVSKQGMQGVKAYFEQRAKKYHISDEVTVGTFMGLGFMFMDGGHPKEAVQLISDAIGNNYPESIELHRVLGRAYEKMKSYQQAANTYEKMVLLAKEQNSPRLDDYENQLKKVKAKI